MRTILFFDLPTITSKDRRNYRFFVRNIKKQGFYMLQESVYVKMSIDSANANMAEQRVNSVLPPAGNVILLTITEKQFANMSILLGKSKSDVLSTDERIVYL